MNYGLRITTEPSEEPITTAEAKQHLLIASAVTGHDSYIDNLITAARKYVEEMLNRSLVTTEWELTLDSFPCGDTFLFLPRSPIQTVDSITYADADGATQTWDDANYILSVAREPARVSLAYSQLWPTVRSQPDAVTIAYTAGYGDAASVPMPIKQAILLLVGHWFEHRNEVDNANMKQVPIGAMSLIESFRVGDEFTCYSGEK